MLRPSAAMAIMRPTTDQATDNTLPTTDHTTTRWQLCASSDTLLSEISGAKDDFILAAVVELGSTAETRKRSRSERRGGSDSVSLQHSLAGSRRERTTPALS